MGWLTLAIALLQLVNKLVDWGRAQADYDKALDRQIAEQSAAILAKTEFGNAALKKISDMPDSAVDDLLRSLEPKAADK